MNEKKYVIYIILSLVYPIIKLIYYINGFLRMRAILYGLIAGGITICTGIFAIYEYKKEHKGAGKPVGHWLAALIPLMIIVLTPLVMMLEKGSQWLQGERLTVLIIFEVLAIAQFVTAILMFRELIFKRGEDKLMMPGIGFVIMKTVLTVRNIFRKPEKTLRKIGLKKGQIMLDYGCGIGSFTIPASQIVGNNGVIHAVDIHPLAIKTVKKKIKKGAFKNIKTILSSRNTGLPDECVDIVLLYDVLQMIRNKEKLLEEIHRVVKPDGRFFATSEHLDMDEFMNILTKGKLFTLVGQKGKLFEFKKKR